MHRHVSFVTGNMTIDESYVMIAEKPVAYAQGVHNMAASAMKGNSPFDITRDAVRPIRARAEENVVRLRGDRP